MQDSILLVDDEPNVISSVKRALLDQPYEIYSAGSGAEGLKLLDQKQIKVIISDEMMPVMTGAEFLSAVKERMPETLRIMLTGHASLEAAMNAVNSGEIYRFFVKPWNDIELKLAIRSALEKYNLEAENRRLLKIVKRQALDLKLLEESTRALRSSKRTKAATSSCRRCPKWNSPRSWPSAQRSTVKGCF